MGSNQSKPARDPEAAGNENQPPNPASPGPNRPKKRKAKDINYIANETGFNDTAKLKMPESSTNITKMSAYSAIGSDPAENIGKQPEREDRSKPSQRYMYENETIWNQSKKTKNKTSATKKKYKKPDNFNAMHNCEPENNTSIVSESAVDTTNGNYVEDSTLRTKSASVDATCPFDEEQTLSNGIQPSDETDGLSHAFMHSKIETETETETETSPTREMLNDKGINDHATVLGYEANKDVGVSYTVTDQRDSSLLATAVGEEIQNDISASNSISGIQATDSFKLPEPNLKVSLTTSNSSMLTTSVSALSKTSSWSTTLDSPALSIAGLISSDSTNTFLQNNATRSFVRSYPFGNFTGSTDSSLPTLTSTASTISFGLSNYHSQSADSSTQLMSGNNHGNFSMASSTAMSMVSSNRNGSSILSSSAQFNFTPSFGYNSSPEHNSHISFTSHNNTNALSDITTNSVTSGTNYGSLNRNHLEDDIETDSLDIVNNDAIQRQYRTDGAIARQLQSFFNTYNGDGYYGTDYSTSSTDCANTQDLAGDFITVRTSVGDTTTRISAKNIRLVNPNYRDELTDENMGIILERPKYPRYATLASRSKSFENSWPVTNKMSWEKLPEAGFVYTGTADCVRCFYCNGGLREWLKNDCPWTEHARYYPHCPHVRQCKGDDFIRIVREGTDDAAYAQDEDSGSDMEVDVADDNPLPRDHEAMRIAAEFITDQGLLEKSVFYLKNVLGKTDFDAQELAGVAFDIDEGTINIDSFENTVQDDIEVTVSEEPLETQEVDDIEDLETDSGLMLEETRILKERSLCKVCLDATACVLFLDCGHMIACPMCAPALKNCAVCRAEVKGTVRIQFATD